MKKLFLALSLLVPLNAYAGDKITIEQDCSVNVENLQRTYFLGVPGYILDKPGKIWRRADQTVLLANINDGSPIYGAYMLDLDSKRFRHTKLVNKRFTKAWGEPDSVRNLFIWSAPDDLARFEVVKAFQILTDFGSVVVLNCKN